MTAGVRVERAAVPPMQRIHHNLAVARRALEDGRAPSESWVSLYERDVAWLMSQQARTPLAPPDAPAPYARGSDTSRAAARSLGPDGVRSCRVAVLGVIAAAAGGVTCDAVEEILGWTHQNVSARINGLRNSGDIYDSGERCRTRSGRMATVWRAHAATL